MLLGMLAAVEEYQNLKERVTRLERVSGFSLDTLTELFMKGYTLHEGVRPDT